MSLFLTEAVANRAIDLAVPFIKGLIKDDLAKRRNCHIVVLNRGEISFGSPYGDMYLAERSFGNRAKWEHPYDDIACNKAHVSNRTGLSTREVQMMRQDLLEPGDTVYFGSVVLGDIVVACSGFDAEVDELIAMTILKTIVTIMELARKAQRLEGVETFELD